MMMKNFFILLAFLFACACVISDQAVVGNAPREAVVPGATEEKTTPTTAADDGKKDSRSPPGGKPSLRFADEGGRIEPLDYCFGRYCGTCCPDGCYATPGDMCCGDYACLAPYVCCGTSSCC